MPKGSIKSWRRDRGFGFINVEGQEEDVFVHISELRDLGRPPRIGDNISFSIETQDNGKVRAINCKVKGDNASSSVSGKKSNILIAVIVISVIALGLYYYLS